MMLRQLLLMPSMSVLFILMGRVHVDVKQTSVLRIALLWDEVVVKLSACLPSIR